MLQVCVCVCFCVCLFLCFSGYMHFCVSACFMQVCVLSVYHFSEPEECSRMVYGSDKVCAKVSLISGH